MVGWSNLSKMTMKKEQYFVIQKPSITITSYAFFGGARLRHYMFRYDMFYIYTL